MVAFIFRTDAAVPVTVEARERFVGEEGERLFEHYSNEVRMIAVDNAKNRCWDYVPFMFSMLSLVLMIS